MKIAVVAMTIWLGSVASAFARTSIPMIDNNAVCTAYAKKMNGGEEMRQSCLSSQQQTFEILVPMWHAAPAAVQKTCAENGATSYAELGYCIATGGKKLEPAN